MGDHVMMIVTAEMPMSPHLPARPQIGVILLETNFPRPPGDIGQALTYTRAGLEVRFFRVPSATARRVVIEADPSLLQPFVEAAQALRHAGAGLITTTCGFLARYQEPLQAAVSVPVITSGLLACRSLDGPGIVTFDAASLRDDVLRGAGVPAGTPVEGLEPGCQMREVILNDQTEMDLEQARQDVVSAALRLVKRHPGVRHLVLECANMPPYRQAVAQATGRPVHDLETLLLDHVRKTIA
jgi:hypothetical protein